MSNQIVVAVIITVHNRKEITLEGLNALFSQKIDAPIQLEVFLVDDASVDGTAMAVKKAHPAINLIEGDGDLWWAGGMHKAFDIAVRQSPDFLLWLNDDTFIFNDALERALGTFEQQKNLLGEDSIIVGCTKYRDKNKPSYGGLKIKSRIFPLKYEIVPPLDNRPIYVDSFNGNFVLLSKGIYKELGNLDKHYRHSFADLDYGYRAKKMGVQICQIPGYVGVCDPNPRSVWQDASATRSDRIKSVLKPNGLHPKEWFRFARQHGGYFWPLQFLSPYIKIIFGLQIGKESK